MNKDLTKAHVLPLVAMCVLIGSVPTLVAPSPPAHHGAVEENRPVV